MDDVIRWDYTRSITLYAGMIRDHALHRNEHDQRRSTRVQTRTNTQPGLQTTTRTPTSHHRHLSLHGATAARAFRAALRRCAGVMGEVGSIHNRARCRPRRRASPAPSHRPEGASASPRERLGIGSRRCAGAQRNVVGGGSEPISRRDRHTNAAASAKLAGNASEPKCRSRSHDRADRLRTAAAHSRVRR